MIKKRYVKQRINSETAYTNLKQSLFEIIYQLPWILTPIAIQLLTTIFYMIIWRRWKANIWHIHLQKLTNIDTREINE